MKILTIALVCTLFASSVYAQNDGAYLDQKYKNLLHPVKNLNAINKSISASDTKEVISYQSPVRSQASRGTCSIFSATAYLEGLLVKKGDADSSIDLSEEWLQYTAVRNNPSDGSSAYTNFRAIRDFGMPNEQSYPYIGEDWTEVFNPLKDIRCAGLTGVVQKSCFIVHRDPSLLIKTDAEIMEKYSDEEFVNARREANAMKETLKFSRRSILLYSVNEIKSLLLSGTPVVLEIDFYYGAWNHREADAFGIGRNLEHWSKGIVTNPEIGSLDAEISPKHPSGHSILVVGFDDNVIIQKTLKMKDGTFKNFTYKGVYYFKNSWGTSSFGSDFEINGDPFPGYGMIVQKHAEEQGQFFLLPLI